MEEMDAVACRKSGIKYLEEENYNQAIENLSQAIRLNPNDSVAYGARALAHNRKKDFSNAWKDIDEAIRLDPNNAPAYANRGTWKLEIAYGNFLIFEWIRTGEYRGAVADLEMAVKLQPDNIGFQHVLNKAKANGIYLNPSVKLKKRLIVLLAFILAGIIISTITFIREGIVTALINGMVMGVIFGGLAGLLIVPWLIFAKKALAKIPVTFRLAFESFAEGENGGIIALIKSLLFAIIITVLWVPLKLIVLLYICPFIGIYQGVRLLIEQKKIKKQAARG